VITKQHFLIKEIGMDMVKGDGWKCSIVITCDDGNSLGEALQKVIDDLSCGKEKSIEASDEYAYSLILEK
jgi:hypothetical protein